MPLDIADEKKKHVKRKVILAEELNHFEKGRKLLVKAGEMLGTDDPIVQKFRTAMSVYKNVSDDITGFIEKGKILEKFETE